MEEKFNFRIQDSVQWYEGQLLYPHHYQQMRYEIQQLSLCYLTISSPWYWGINYMEIDETVLPNGIIRINKILAIFPDGSVLEKSTKDSYPLELDVSGLKDQLQEKEMTIHLAVVKRQSDIANCSGDFPRYYSDESEGIVDENTGESPLNIAKLRLKAFIVTEDGLSARLSSFPLMRITLRDGCFQKTNFVAPTSQLSQEDSIGQEIKGLITKIRRHISYLSIRLQTLRTKDMSSVLDYYTNVYNTLTSRILILEALCESQNTHPHEMYKELNIEAGVFCSLNHEKVPPIFPPYDHNDLKGSFDPLINFINDIIESVKNPAVSIIFDQQDRVFYQEIKASYLTTDTVIISIHLGTNMTIASGASWIKGAVIACDSSIKEIKEKRILGARREVVEQIPGIGLTAAYNQVFVKVKIDPTFIKPGEILRIFNPSDREDARPEDLFLYVIG